MVLLGKGALYGLPFTTVLWYFLPSAYAGESHVPCPALRAAPCLVLQAGDG